MEKISVQDLLNRYALGQCSEEESLWVENWYREQDADSSLPITRDEFQADIREIYGRLEKEERKVRRFYALKIAASLIGVFLTVGIGYHFYQNSKPVYPVLVSGNDIVAGGHKARLILSDGSQIDLDTLKVGNSIQDESLQIRKIEDGAIEYIALGNKGPATFSNELQTDEGGQYLVHLLDGTKVWLNAASGLRYSIPFESSKRKVELTGEAYFEVAESDAPFLVKTKQQEIEVLGTHFNVHAYENEQRVKTTLLEGSVRIIQQPLKDQSRFEDVILHPGEQAVVTQEGRINVDLVNVMQTIAWKDGLFSFAGEDLETVMREFSRWYGVEVRFEGEVPTTKLWGQVYRNVSAAEALKVLEYFGLKFKIITDEGISKIEISEK